MLRKLNRKRRRLLANLLAGLWKESVEIAVVRQPVDLPAVTLNPLAGMMGVIAMSHQLPKSLLPSFFRQLVLTRWARHAKRVLCAWLN